MLFELQREAMSRPPAPEPAAAVGIAQQKAPATSAAQGAAVSGSQAETVAAPLRTEAGDKDDVVMSDHGWAEIVKQLKADSKVSNNMLSKFRADGAKLGKTLRSLGKCRLHAEKLAAKVKDLDEGRLPKGQQPWKVPFESSHWIDKPSEGVCEKVPYLSGCRSLEEARLTVQRHCLAASSLIDLEVEKSRIASLEAESSCETFVATCMALYDTTWAAVTKTVGNLKPPPGLFEPVEVMVRTEAANVYRHQVHLASMKLKEFEDQIAKQKELTEKAHEEAMKLKPPEVLAKAFEQFVSSKSHKHKPNTIDFMKMVDFVPAAPSWVEKTKNGLTPQAAGGQNQAKNQAVEQKGKGNGNGKKPKNKSKSAPKGGQQPKGKGKGKAEGKAKGNGKGSGTSGKSGGKGQPKGKGKGKAK